ncbi:NADP-dependent oxidoreductase [Phanerochaete sordida]|uniref:NADP-dependent oxidoreductase n=1 Tax=Phanerochaete sordida TaxID=48140 RepID=A0A9P3LFF4_9APHY|nr:NADP-dependent oxidoreductase [Phanerochaete sordida]
MVKNTALIYVSHPTGRIEPDVHFRYVDGEINLENVPLNGSVLLKALYLSSEPLIRYRMREAHVPLFCPPIELGDPVDNFGIGKVVRSEDPNFSAGDYVYGYLEFSEYSVYPGRIAHAYKGPLTKVNKLPNVPLSIYLGALGMPGTTAFQGIKGLAAEKLETAKTMFVSGAAGPVGTFVIEYAKVLAPHIKVIASAGNTEKIRILKDVGTDVAFNYKEQDTAAILKEHGLIDIYWDHVAGSTLDAALKNFADGGLIISCGAISQASGDDSNTVHHFDEIFKRSLTVKGILCYRGESASVVPEFFNEAVPLVISGKVSSHEHRYFGLEAAAKSLAGVHLGDNVGKAVIVVAEE